jgi:hypothetical protein
MRAPWPRARRVATVLAACVATGLAAQSCAVMSSSSDCADKAACPDDGGGTSSGGGGVEGATGDDAPGQGDDTADGAGAADDVTVDQLASADAAAIQDVGSGSDARLDVSADVAVDRAVDAPADAFDGCIATGPEICTNGIDDNCDGKIDCADPACSGYKCAAAVPSGGWIGPVLLWTGLATAARPACPTGYTTALDANTGPTGTADTCGCSCAASGQVCSVTGNFHGDQMCNTTGCATGAPASNGACTAAPATGCGSGGSFEVGLGAAQRPTGGRCTPQMAPTVVPPIGWTTSARICSLTVPVDVPGGCGASSEWCVPGSGTASGFVATPCVYQSGDIACPAAYTNDRTVVFSAENDGRTCAGCTCTSSAPAGGACTGTISIFPGAGCTGNVDVYTLGTRCLAYNDQAPINPMSVQANYTVTPGTCAVATQATPTGSVTPTGPTTVCCM